MKEILIAFWVGLILGAFIAHALHRIRNRGFKDLLEALDGYLNAGSKEERREAAKRAKIVYRRYTGKDYKNKNER